MNVLRGDFPRGLMEIVFISFEVFLVPPPKIVPRTFATPHHPLSTIPTHFSPPTRRHLASPCTPHIPKPPPPRHQEASSVFYKLTNEEAAAKK